MANLEANCGVLVYHTAGEVVREADLQKELESKDEQEKIAALKKVILLTLNGEKFPKLLMSVIKFCLHTEHHEIKKLLLMYWEVVEKKGKDGVLLHEMILVCNALKNNLTHPNEYIRGSTLRFLCKIMEAEILESLIPAITANLEHRHSYVRKNAVFAVHTIYEHFPELVADAPELIEELLQNEKNPQAKRNAFLMLFHCDDERAVNYLGSVAQDISSAGESFQLVVLELIRKVCRADPLVKSQYIHIIYALVNSTSHAVAFEGANTLVALSSAPTAVRAAVTAYCLLLKEESDNNIKLIILNRLDSLRRRNEKILQEMLLEIMRTLSSPSIDIRKKTLDLTLQLVAPRNVDQVVQMLKKEMSRTEAREQGQADDAYRKLLVDAMHKCAVRFPEVVQNVVHLLMNHVGDEDAAAALDVVYFVREIVEEYPQLRDDILAKLMESFDEIRSSQVFRVACWILGEYCLEPGVMDLALMTIRGAIGPLPLVSVKKVESGDDEKEEKSRPTGPKVLSDGTYATQAMADPSASGVSGLGGSSLRNLLLKGDYFLAGAVATTVTKLTLRFAAANGYGSPEVNEEISKALLLITSMLRLGTSVKVETQNTSNSTAPAGPAGPAVDDKVLKPIDSDSHARLMICVRVLLEPQVWGEVFTTQSRETFAAMLKLQREKQSKKDADKKVEVVSQVDDLINIRQLKSRGGQLAFDFIDDDEADMQKAVGSGASTQKSSKMDRVYQLTGCADPVYAEAVLTVLDYDIVLEILVVNQTKNVLQNLQVELNASGDLKVVDRPQVLTLEPFGTATIKTNVKVTSTESGVIFGNVVYNSASGTTQHVVVMNNIMVDIMDYISPATCTDTAFRSMWAEFEWENKVAVNTDITDLGVYLDHIVRLTHMRCMTPDASMSGSCNFLAANLYATSLFGEDALLNLSVEKQMATGKITGFIRIRSKTQGIALSLGDKITSKQRVVGK